MDTQSHRHGVAIFGLGRIGCLRLEDLVKTRRASVEWLVDIEGANQHLKRLINQFNLTNGTKIANTDGTEEVFSDSRVSVVFICTPVPEHEKLVQKALQAGKHVFCEKPLALSLESVQFFVKEAKKRGLFLYCGFNKRHDPSIRDAYSKVVGGELGDLRTIKICCREPLAHSLPDYFKLSGGIFHDSCIHDFDLACWFAGEDPMSVVVMGHAFSDIIAKMDDVDSCSVMLKFPSGLIAILDNTRGCCYGYEQQIEILGQKGMLKVTSPRLTTVEEWRKDGTTLAPIETNGMIRYRESFTKQMDVFLDILEKKCELDVTGHEIQRATIIATLCIESLRSGQVVPVPKHKNEMS